MSSLIILIYEDNIPILNALNLIVTNYLDNKLLQSEVYLTSSFQEAEDIIQELSKKEKKINLTILDTYFRESSIVGPSIAKKVRENNELSYVIGISGAHNAEREWCNFSKNFKFLSKPFEANTLLAIIEKYIENKE